MKNRHIVSNLCRALHSCPEPAAARRASPYPANLPPPATLDLDHPPKIQPRLTDYLHAIAIECALQRPTPGAELLRTKRVLA